MMSTSYRIWGVVLLALCLRLIGLSDSGIWLDEVYPITFASLPLFDGLVAALRFDLHPPLYVVQLHLWSWFGQSDTWMLLNSVLWSVLGVVALYWAVRERFNGAAAFWAALFLAVMPRQIEFAQSARMYAMLTTLIIVAWGLQNRLLQPEARRRDTVLFVSAAAAIAWTHVTGFFVLGLLGLYGGAMLVKFRAGRPQIRRFVLAQGAVVLALLLPVANALVRNVGHATVPGLDAVGAAIPREIVGPSALVFEPFLILAAGLTLVLTVGVWYARKGRSELTLLVVLPLLVLLLLSYTVKPAWHSRNMVLVLPFLSIVGALLIVRLGAWLRLTPSGDRRQAGVVGGAVVAVLGLAALPYYLDYRKPNDFQEIGRVVGERVHAGDVLYIPRRDIFWGVAREWLGPDWGSPMKVQDEAENPQWSDLYRLVGQDVLAGLGVSAETRSLRHDGVTLVLGYSRDVMVEHTRQVWVLDDPQPSRAVPSLAGFREVYREPIGGFALKLMIQEVYAQAPRDAGALR
ncbi:glycosyltransferase family 39 protein [Marinivivus vitaminiproducens]|uniref:glycosyltransferase family 39 protein n=1 Tax=Marinivivus vitaminiproducens TaxID=3035935 RepID=UPI0027AA78D8|nr:glycosyltransferase family 39 protein [Geminicoccaceae bacterium SCSIO 64248]